MSVEVGRPLVPTDREVGLGADRALPDFSTPVTAPSERRRRGPLGTVGGYLSKLDIRKVDGPLLPLIVLGLLGMIAKFATEASSLALPDIQNDLGIDLAAAVSLVAITQTPLTVLRLWVGHAADRLNRLWMTRVAAVMRIGGSLLVASATGLPLYAGGQLTQSASSTVGEPASFTLLTDYYSVAARTRVIFWLFQITSIAGIIAYPIVGIVGEAFGWRAVFVGLAIATAAVLALTIPLKEPTRGYWERKAMGAEDEVAVHEQPPLGFTEAFRTAWSIRYLRVLCLIAPFGSVIALYSLVIQQNYLASEYGLGIADRGWISAITATFGTLGLLVVAPWVSSHIGSSPRVIVMIQALQGLLASGIYLLLLVTHNLTFAVVVLSAEALIVSTAFPITFSLQNLVIPPRMRGFGLQINQAFGALSFFLLAFGVSRVADEASWGRLFLLIVAINVVVAVIVPTALPHIERDIANARISSMADEELRRYRASGRSAALLCRQLEVGYGGVTVISGLDLEIAPGEVVALLGTNGAGKSTLLRAIAGSLEPTGGAVFVGGVDVTHKPAHERTAAGVVLASGGRGVTPSLTVRESLRLAAWTHRDDAPWVEHRIERTLELFPQLAAVLSTRAGDLSGGEQQMLTLAQAYLTEPELLLIDELSLGLAPQVIESLLDSLRALNAMGTTIVLVEQSLTTALAIADRAVFLERGAVVFDGSTVELAGRPDLLRSTLIGNATSGRRRRAVETGSAPPLLEVRDLTVSFGPVPALREVSLDVARREVVGVIGPNGAGKTTLFDAISGLVPTDTGTVLLKGVDLSRRSLDARAAAGLGRSFQSARLFPSLTVRETLQVAMQRRIRHRSPLLAALWAPGARAAERASRQRVDDVLDLLGLGAQADTFVGELSTGSRRAVDVGCVMVSAPDLLLLDEPSAGLAQAETEALGPLITRIARETGCGVLLIEHDLPLVTGIADRLVAMELGQVVADGPPAAVLADPVVQRAYLASLDPTQQTDPQ